jgi:hypothetical protein
MSKAPALLLALLLAACTSGEQEQAPVREPAKPAAPDPAQVAAEQAAAEARRLAALWDYQSVAVEGGVQKSASIYSRTVPVEEGELAPIADARLVLRDHPSWGLSAYLVLTQSRFDCGKPCAMEIAFDDQPPKRFAGKQADTGTGPALFINDDGAFLEALKRAKLVRITLPKGSGLVSTLKFEVGGYDPSRYH